jgi:fumarate hydratase class I
MAEFEYEDLLPVHDEQTKYRLISSDGVKSFSAGDREFLEVAPEALTLLTSTAIHDINHYLRTEHLIQLTKILQDPESSPNDRFVALDL